MKVDNKKLSLLKSEHKTILEWFAFVDSHQRTKIDNRLYTKIDNMIEQQNQPAFAMLTSRGVQIVMRWYCLIPEVAKDNRDMRIIKRMNVFLKKDGEN